VGKKKGRMRTKGNNNGLKETINGKSCFKKKDSFEGEINKDNLI